ncbi:Glycosyl transferase family 2 [Austwickia chelonae]|uniref:Putative glycosyltransferase n=1 Tax=Austwickia chelonae NBRC 105200 TaxID=1184607 RepID=K6VN70_9MICO|nr:glycosyltransferase family A protein [Austwickia chelonae]GAB76830.1 putative glycosyltransferase [Austwickia chelonae NBRC 105200]SEW31267.1 Glycosyl transferase family 2 [Austwickia chelonae]
MKRSSPAKLSVVIACFNASETLAEQLESLATQNCDLPWEVILADNGSTDHSVAIAETYAHRIPLRVIDAGERRGPAHARNRGVEAAEGEWVAFCDADDIVGTGWVAAACAAMDSHPFVAGQIDVTRLNSERLARTRRMEQQEGLQPGSSNSLGLPHAGSGNMAIHRQIFLDVGGFDEEMPCLEDTDLCWRVQLRGTPLEYAPDMMVHTRLRSTLGGTLRQGLDYGRGYTRLEERYGSLAPQVTPVERSQGQHLPESSVGAALRTLFLVPTVRGVTWQLAWHLGRRTATPSPEASPPPLPRS